MTENRDLRSTQRHDIRWPAFCCALICAPLVVAFFGAWAVIPIAAVAIGTPTYLLFGAPVFYVTVRRVGDNPAMLMAAGLIAHLVSYPAVLLYFGPDGRGLDSVELIFRMGLFFAPLWGLVFGLLYAVFSNVRWLR